MLDRDFPATYDAHGLLQQSNQRTRARCVSIPQGYHEASRRFAVPGCPGKSR
jgi:hypothetical protein